MSPRCKKLEESMSFILWSVVKLNAIEFEITDSLFPCHVLWFQLLIGPQKFIQFLLFVFFLSIFLLYETNENNFKRIDYVKVSNVNKYTSQSQCIIVFFNSKHAHTQIELSLYYFFGESWIIYKFSVKQLKYTQLIFSYDSSA